MRVPQEAEGYGVPHAGDHAVAGVGQDVEQEERPEHRRLEHRVPPGEALDVLIITPGLALQRGPGLTHRPHPTRLIVSPAASMLQLCSDQMGDCKC